MNKEITNSVNHLKKGNIILYPTDTVWGIGCDATNEKAVQKIYAIKQRAESKSLLILVDSYKMLKTIINDNIPPQIKEIITNSEKPTSVIYQNPKLLARNVIARDNTVAIRIVQDNFCKELIKKFGKPIVSTSANISGEKTPFSFDEINELIKNRVDYSVELRRKEIRKKSSKIIKLNENGTLVQIRK